MQLTITITDQPQLPKEDLNRFFSVAQEQGKSPESLLISMIKDKISGTPTPRKKKAKA